MSNRVRLVRHEQRPTSTRNLSTGLSLNRSAVHRLICGLYTDVVISRVMGDAFQRAVSPVGAIAVSIAIYASFWTIINRINRTGDFFYFDAADFLKYEKGGEAPSLD